jgi:hypothetical protein
MSMSRNAEKVKNAAVRFNHVNGLLGDIDRSFAEYVGTSRKVSEEVSVDRSVTLGMQQKTDELHQKTVEVLGKIEEVYEGLLKHKESNEELADLGDRLNRAAAALEPLVSADAVITGEDSEQLVDTGTVTALLKKELAAVRSDVFGTRSSEAFCKGLVMKIPEIVAAWVNDTKGRFVFSVPPAGIANAKVREWFNVASQGKDFISAPYISAISGKPCITIAVPVMNEQNHIIGVLGVDCGARSNG